MSESKENILWRGNTDFSGYVVDFAVLDSETITSPKEIDSHVINLDGIEVTVSEFKKLFYPDGNTFQLNIAEQDSEYVKMRGRTVKSVPFKLVKAITRFYGDDLGVELNCMDPCTTTEITSQITGYKSLMDFCEVNCHLSWAQIIEALYNKFPDGKHNEITSKTHNLRLSVRFHNANKQIKDVMVTFNYEVDFTTASGENLVEINNIINSVSAQTAGSGSSAKLVTLVNNNTVSPTVLEVTSYVNLQGTLADQHFDADVDISTLGIVYEPPISIPNQTVLVRADTFGSELVEGELYNITVQGSETGDPGPVTVNNYEVISITGTDDNLTKYYAFKNEVKTDGVVTGTTYLNTAEAPVSTMDTFQHGTFTFTPV